MQCLNSMLISMLSPSLERRLANGSRVSVAQGAELGHLYVSAA